MTLLILPTVQHQEKLLNINDANEELSLRYSSCKVELIAASTERCQKLYVYLCKTTLSVLYIVTDHWAIISHLSSVHYE